MPRLKALKKTDADAKARGLLDAVESKLGMIPNLMSTMANSPAVLESYLSFSGALAKGALPAGLREQIALAVGEANGCDYCLAAHSALGRRAGLSEAQVADARRGAADDERAAAALGFARKLVAERGHVGDGDVDGLRAAGFGDGEIAEIVGNVALNLFTNYFNHAAATEVDFPKVGRLPPAAACAC